MNMERQLDKAVFQQMDQLHRKNVGTGSPETTRQEFMQNSERDLLAIYLNNPSVLDYVAMGLEEHPKAVRAKLFGALISPIQAVLDDPLPLDQ
jgi:hypothetical protein